MIVRVKFASNDKKIGVKFSDINQKISANFGAIQTVTKTIEAEYYDGKYSVTPTPDEQTLKTKEKKMRDDLIVTAIPVFDVSNNSGGTTFYIASNGTTPILGEAVLGSTVI